MSPREDIDAALAAANSTALHRTLHTVRVPGAGSRCTGGGRHIKIHFIRTPKRRSAVLEEIYLLLAERGFHVTEGIPDTGSQDLDTLPENDLYVLKARTVLPVSVAGVLHQRGARILNPYPASALLRNKIVATAMLRGAGIPTPRTWAVTDPALLHPAEWADRMPLILKPLNGIHGRAITVIRTVEDLERVPPTDLPVVIQGFVDGCMERFKLHCIGEHVFATRKPFSLDGTHQPGQPTAVSAEMRDIALRCGKLFGLGLYGLDVLKPDGRPIVVDVNSFPGYDGIPSIAPLIVEYIDAYASGRIELPNATGGVVTSGGRPVNEASFSG